MNTNVELIKKRELAICFDKTFDSLSDLRELLQLVFPADNPATNADYPFYIANTDGFRWLPQKTINMPVISVYRLLRELKSTGGYQAPVEIPKHTLCYVWNDEQPESVVCGKFLMYENGLYYIDQRKLRYGYKYCSLQNPLI